MLPIEVGNLVLSDDGRLRVEAYFQRFCEGENGRVHGLEHLVFACHAAFPLLISPKLANLVWLNFNTYTQYGVRRKISPIVVSDFLLSPLLRPIANRQYEMVPEIRAYLLYLLKSGHWFSSFGIESYPDDRLQSLGHFLYQYCADSQSLAEHDTQAFRQANQWAALAYLEPEMLAVEIASAFKRTLGTATEQADTHRQLQLHAVLDRFGKQIDLDIHQSEAQETAAFVNLHRYSQANRAYLFEEEDRQVSDLFYQLDGDFIEEPGQPLTQIELPIQPQFRDRLERKKAHTTRIFPTLVAVEDGLPDQASYSNWGIDALARWFARDAYPAATMANFQFLAGRDATYPRIVERLEYVLQQARPEDVVFVCLSGSFGWRQAGIQFQAWEDGQSDGLTPAALGQLLGRFPAIQQVVLVLDGDTDWLPWRATGADIIAPACGTGSSRRYRNMPSGYLSGLLAAVLQKYRHGLSYRDLQLLLETEHADRWQDMAPPPIVYVRKRAHWPCFALTYAEPTPGPTPVLAYRETRGEWAVLDDGFRQYVPQMPAISAVLAYDGKPLPTPVRGYLDSDRGRMDIVENGDSLDPGQIYKPLIDIQPLYFSMENPDERARLQALVKTLEARPQREYTIAPTLYESPSLLGEGGLRIFARDAETFEVHFFDAGQREPTWKWQATGEVGLADSIAAFGRYQYLKNLQNPPAVDVSSGWDQLDSGWDKRLEACVAVVDGKIRVKPFAVELRGRADQPVYAELYTLSASDFSVKRINPTLLQITGERPASITVNEPALFLKALREGTELHFKLLTHSRPVFPDLEQGGVNIVRL